MIERTITDKKSLVEELFKVGAHFGFVKSRRHPSAKSFIFGAKNGLEIFDLEKTSEELERAVAFVEKKAETGGLVLFVSSKSEAKEAIVDAGEGLSMPYVAGRWIGGTLTNFGEIKKRIARLEELISQKEKGELAKYTKKERLLIDRDIEKLTKYFGGLTTLKSLPKLLVVVDPKKEAIAVAEARRMNIPIVGLAGSDTDLSVLDYAIPGNDSSKQTIGFVLGLIVNAIRQGKTKAPKEESTTKIFRS